MIKCLLVGIGGAAGAICRYLIGLIPLETSHGFPVKTLVINVIGAFLIGLISAAAEKHSLSPMLVLMLKTGVCGGFTTFSTFALETGQLMENGNTLYALGYVLASVIFSVAAVFFAQGLMK